MSDIPAKEKQELRIGLQVVRKNKNTDWLASCQKQRKTRMRNIKETVGRDMVKLNMVK